MNTFSWCYRFTRITLLLGAADGIAILIGATDVIAVSLGGSDVTVILLSDSDVTAVLLGAADVIAVLLADADATAADGAKLSVNKRAMDANDKKFYEPLPRVAGAAAI